MKKLWAVFALFMVLCFVAQAQTVGTTTITAQGSFTLNGGDVLTLSAQVINCSEEVILYNGNPISVAPNQPLGSNGFTANGSQLVTATLPGNDKISCGGQDYSLYAITWKDNGYPITPTETYRFTDGGSYNLATTTPVSFVPPQFVNGAGVACASNQVLQGFTKDYAPICGSASATGATFPNASAANQVLASTGPGNTYQAINLPAVALNGQYSSLIGSPTLGTAASLNATAFDSAGAAAAAQAAAATSAASLYMPINGSVAFTSLPDGPDGSDIVTANQMNAAISLATGGSGSSGGSSGFPTGIGTVNMTGYMTESSSPAIKTCYIQGSLPTAPGCTGGVGSNAPFAVPTRTNGNATPNANTGTSNAVAVMTMESNLPQPQFTDVLWTFTGGGLGTDSVDRAWYSDFWFKSAFASGHQNFEFDTEDFDSGWLYTWGTQCNGTKGDIQYSSQTSGWLDTNINCTGIYDGAWHHIQQSFHRQLTTDVFTCGTTATPAPCQTHDAIAIDGKVYQIAGTVAASASPLPAWSGSGEQFQIDGEPSSASSGSPASYTAYVDSDFVQAGTQASSGTTGPGGGGGSSGGSGTGDLASYSFDGASPLSGLTAVGSCAVSTTQEHTPSDSLACPAGSNYEEITFASGESMIFSRQYIWVSSVGSSSNSFLRYYVGGAQILNFYLTATTDILSVYNNQTSTSTALQGTAFPTGAWHYIETEVVISPTAGQIIAKVDGTTVYTGTGLNTGSSNITGAWFGQLGNTPPTGWGTTYLDNVDFADNGFIGSI